MGSQVVLNHLNYIYNFNTPVQKQALFDVSLEINSGSFVGIVGKTGSGKSTLVQMINGSLKPTTGEITVGNITINQKTNNKNLGQLRKKVGMIFQFPEKQVFEETVLKDVAFGPKNFDDDNETSLNKAKRALKLVGISENLFNKSPFEISGGQLRRVAIAGVLSINPDILILDEPTVGLDPSGQRDIMNLLVKLNHQGKTIILISHEMNLVAQFVDRVMVMNNGHLVIDETPEKVFSDEKALKDNSLDLPDAVKIYYDLKRNGIELEKIPLSKAEVVGQVQKKLNGVK